MELLKATSLMRIVSDIGPCYEKLVNEFNVNISTECNVRGKCVKFSPSIINDYLARRNSTKYDTIPSIDKITKEIIGGQVKHWPKKGLLSSGSLSVKYDILNRTGVVNWALANHSSSMTSALAKIIFQIGSKEKLNFGEYIFEKTMKYAKSFVVKLPITFPYLLTRIILNQHPKIMHLEEALSKKEGSLTLDYRLFVRTRVLEIVVSKHQDQSVVRNSSPLSKSSKKDVFLSSWKFQRLFKKELLQASLGRKYG